MVACYSGFRAVWSVGGVHDFLSLFVIHLGLQRAKATLINPHTRFTQPTMSHRRNVSARTIDMGKISLESPPITPALAVFNVFQHEKSAYGANKTKQYWQRTTFLALFALVLISGYVLLVSPPSLSQITHGEGDNSFTGLAAQRLSRLSSEAYRLASQRGQSKGQGSGSSSANDSDSSIGTATSSLQLTPEQELAVLTSFLASLAENVIPSSVDPSRPIDPELVLDFNTRGPHAVQELEQLVADSWVHYPVVLYSKVRGLLCFVASC